MNKSGIILLAVCAVSLSAFAALKPPSSNVELRFVPAEEAYAALKDHLGGDGASSVTSVDVRRNALTLDATHPQAAKAREFLAAFDKRPLQLVVQAVISRRVAATATEKAREVILSRPTCFAGEGQRVVFSVPGRTASQTSNCASNPSRHRSEKRRNNVTPQKAHSRKDRGYNAGRILCQSVACS
jgi:hypothetical protein